tara:strand:- start:591 stop:1589 length:999 start_codon:yes stop_codon:yes gene_type:complete
MVNPEFEIRPSVLVGDTADISLQRTLTVLRNEGLNPTVAVEYFSNNNGVFSGIKEVKLLLAKILPEVGVEVWAIDEGEKMEKGETILRIKAPYSSFGLYDTAICGTLSSSSNWATAASNCVEVAKGIPIICTGSKYVHPLVSSGLDYSSIVGGCLASSTILGSRLSGLTPSGDMPHSLPLLFGDTSKAMQAFDKHIPVDIPRIALIDTFKDETEESIAVATLLRERLRGVRLDTPSERGGVTPQLVKETRLRLDHAGFKHVEIFVSGGINPDRIVEFVDNDAPVNTFTVGSYIANYTDINFHSEIHEIDGRPVAKRGKLPGINENPKLGQIM